MKKKIVSKSGPNFSIKVLTNIQLQNLDLCRNVTYICSLLETGYHSLSIYYNGVVDN